jgi:hypothetical protein
LFEKMKEKAEHRKQQKAFESAQAAHAEWQARVAKVMDYIEIAREFNGLPPGEVDSPLVPKKDETIYAIVERAGLVEPRRLPGQWQGAHRGASIRIAKGVYWRTGGSRGTYKQGEERQTLIDNGTAVITSQRVVFLGAKHTREWAYSNCSASSTTMKSVPPTYKSRTGRRSAASPTEQARAAMSSSD